MIIVKSDHDLMGMRKSCRLASRVRDALVGRVTPGVTTLELAQYADQLIREGGGQSAFLGYRGFPGQICVSVNEEVVHGIPSDRRIAMGDIVSLDVGVVFGDYFGDTATTVMVGVTDPAVLRLVRTTERALAAAIALARPGGRLSDVSHAVQAVVEAEGFSVVRDFVGHGIGKNLHEDPQIPNYGVPGRGPRLRSGMTLAIEPMVNMGGSAVRVLKDGWTVVTRDARFSAHAEHTIAVREDGAEILTA